MGADDLRARGLECMCGGSRAGGPADRAAEGGTQPAFRAHRARTDRLGGAP